MAKKNKTTTSTQTDASSPQNPAPNPGHGAGGGEKEGSFLLGPPTWVDAGGGRWRCAETGHELPEREKEAYARSRACRLALVDHALAHRKPPLNAFKPHPEHKSKLVCNITGDTINKSEEHIWKHINGRRFLNRLEQIELEKMASEEMAEGEVDKSDKASNVSKKIKSDTASKKKDKKKATDVTTSLPRESKPEMDDSDDPEFWMPPVGCRWDNDDGKDRWESSPCKDNDAKNEGASDDDAVDIDDAESRELISRTKRMSVAVGPSSFASRKKKPKKDQ